MNLELMRYLECQRCEKEFYLKKLKEENSEVVDGIISCDCCNSRYLIMNGIPRFVPISYLEFDEDFKNFLNNYFEQDFFIRKIYDAKVTREENQELKKNTSKTLVMNGITFMTGVGYQIM